MRRLATALLVLVSLLSASCNINAPDSLPSATDEVQVILTSAPSPSPAPEATASPSPTIPVQPSLQVATVAPTSSPPPPTPTDSPTPTSPYYEHLVQEDESMFYILQLPQHGYSYEPNVALTVVALNDNIVNADFLPVGQTILIPRPTASSTAVGAQATQELLATLGVDSSLGADLQSGATVGCHVVEAGDSAISIAVTFNTTLEVLSGLNRNLNWYGCQFTEPSGGPDCRPNLSIGQCVNVPQPTPLPTKYPTPTGNETATPTATKLAPRLLSPADGDVSPPGELLLQWVGLSGMAETDEYLVELFDQTAGTEHRQVTSANAYRVPEPMIPSDGQTHIMQWLVTVARQDAQGRYYYVGAQGKPATFKWLSP